MTSRDWVIKFLKEKGAANAAEPLGTDFIAIDPKNDDSGEELPPFTAGIVSSKKVTDEVLAPLLESDTAFDFVVNIPKDSIWTGAGITRAESEGLGWGGIAELLSAMYSKQIRGFQKKEYQFVLRGLQQHTNVAQIFRPFDRKLEIHRHDYDPLTVVLVHEYELTGEHVRHARELYGGFSDVLKTNPNGGISGNASEVAGGLGAQVHQWGGFLGRLNRK